MPFESPPTLMTGTMSNVCRPLAATIDRPKCAQTHKTTPLFRSGRSGHAVHTRLRRNLDHQPLKKLPKNYLGRFFIRHAQTKIVRLTVLAFELTPALL